MKSKLAILLMVLLVALLLLSECGMSQKEIVAAAKECEATGMRAELSLHLIGGMEMKCVPPEVVHE